MSTAVMPETLAKNSSVPGADPGLKPAVVADQDRFQFDLQGFLLLRGALADSDRRELLAELLRLEALEHDDSHWRNPQPNGKTGQPTKQTWPGYLRLNGLLRMSTAFDRLIDYPTVFPYLQEFVPEVQLVNTWSITKTAAPGVGAWHRGVGPEHYSCRLGRIRNRMLNVVFSLTQNTLENGCMIVIPGGHKSNFDLDWSKYKALELPGSIAITTEPGDVLLMSESLLHNGVACSTAEPRTNLYFNYISRDFNVRPTENMFHYAMPPHIRARFTPARKAATEWMETVRTID